MSCGNENNIESKIEVLGLKNGLSLSNVKQAFHKRALRCHPDKGGDPEIMIVVVAVVIVMVKPENVLEVTAWKILVLIFLPRLLAYGKVVVGVVIVMVNQKMCSR